MYRYFVLGEKNNAKKLQEASKKLIQRNLPVDQDWVDNLKRNGDSELLINLLL